ncbi:MAG: GNAT family N-acetyltransferase [Thermodesulfobacteriota bacterium]
MEPAISFLSEADDETAEDIRRLYQGQGWWEPGDEAASIPRIIRGSHCFAVARMNGKIVGMGRAISDGASDAYIQDVVVEPGFRNERLGSRIIQAIVDRLSADRVGWIALVAEEGSQPFYERLGFRPMKGCVPMRYARE